MDMMVDIASGSTPTEAGHETLKYTKYSVNAPIPEVEDKYRVMLETLQASDISSLKFETVKASFEENGFIRPNKTKDLDEDIKYVFFTKINESKDLSGGNFRIYSDDGYSGAPPIEKGYTICFKADTKYEISRLKSGTATYMITFAK